METTRIYQVIKVMAALAAALLAFNSVLQGNQPSQVQSIPTNDSTITIVVYFKFMENGQPYLQDINNSIYAVDPATYHNATTWRKITVNPATQDT